MWRDPGDFTYYFGAWGQPGHHLWTPSGNYLTRLDNERSTRLPTDIDLDQSRMFLPRPERPGDGSMTYVRNSHVQFTVFAWWDRTFDTRPGSCCAIVTGGIVTADEAWERFVFYYPSLVPPLKRPTAVD